MKTQTLDQQAATIYKMFGLIYNFNANEIIVSACPGLPARALFMLNSYL